MGPLGAFHSATFILGSSYRDFSPLSEVLKHPFWKSTWHMFSQGSLGAFHSATFILGIRHVAVYHS